MEAFYATLTILGLFSIRLLVPLGVIIALGYLLDHYQNKWEYSE